MTTRLLAAFLAALLLLTACTSAEEGSDAIEADGDGLDAYVGDSDDAMQDEAMDEEAAMDEEGAREEAVAQGQDPLDAYLPPLIEPEPEPEPVRPSDGINPFVDTRDDDLSTFGLDVDSGSFDLAAATIEDGGRPQADQIRAEEFINAQSYGYDTDDEETFSITTDIAPSPFTTDRDNVILRIGLSTPEAEERQPASLVFVVDTSGSMTDLLPLVQDALRTLAVELEPGDDVAIVTYGDDARVVLDATDAGNRAAILEGISTLRIGGSTNLEAGLDLGFQIARDLAERHRTTRVILASDGIANVGNTSPDRILDTARQAASNGIELVTVGFGQNGFNDPLMEQLADQGDGFYAFVDTLAQADALFRTDLVATQPPIAREARAQVVFDDDQVRSYRLVGYENRDIADEDFRNDDIDAGELVAGHTVTALYELELMGRNTGSPLATVQLRWLDPLDGTPRERAHDVTAADITRDWRDTPASFRLASTVGAWAEHLRGSPYAPDREWELLDEIDALRGRAAVDEEVDRLFALINQTI